MSITISRSYKYVDYNVSAPNNRGYLTIDTSDWINKPWMFYELPSLKFEIYTETDGELLKYKNFTREIRTYNPVYSPLGVLNVTIDIRNVPEEFILRITPIFDNDAVAARNMLIENGIENGDIWGSDQDVPTQLFNLDLEFIECEGEYVPPTPPVPPTHEETITGIPPITFDGSTGEPLVSWTISGNGEQTGTPSPDNIIMPTFCGVRTAQLFDGEIASREVGMGSNRYGFLIEKAGTYTIKITGDVENGDFCYARIYSNGEYSEPFYLTTGYSTATYTNTISDGEIIIVYNASGSQTKAQSEAKFARWKIMVNEGSTALPYEPFGWTEKITCGGKTTPVYLGQVSTVRRIKNLVLTGEETIAGSGLSGGWIVTNLPVNMVNTVGAITAICSHYKAVSNSAMTALTTGDMCISTNSTNRINFATDISTAADFKAFLAAQYANGTPVTVWYVLATPTTGIVNEPLAKIGEYADELHSTDAGVTIPTAKGDNVLTVETELQPSEMTITYMKEGQ